jgi:hypothetical protein
MDINFLTIKNLHELLPIIYNYSTRVSNNKQDQFTAAGFANLTLKAINIDQSKVHM